MKPTNASHAIDEMHNDDTAHEESDINISALAWSMVVMFGVVIVTAILMYFLFWNVLEQQARERDPKPSPLAMPPTAMPKTTTESPFFGNAPEPRLMTVEPLNLQEVRAAEQQTLHGYGWVDENAKIARVPIDEAKKLIAERGLPVRPDPISDARVGTRVPASGESSAGRVITRPPAAATGTVPTPPPAPAAGHGAEHK